MSPRPSICSLVAACGLLACTGSIGSGADEPGASDDTPGARSSSAVGAPGKTGPGGPGDTTGPGPGMPPPPTVAAPGAPNVVACDPKGDVPPPRRIWRLKAKQYQNTISALLNGRPTAVKRKLPDVPNFDPPFDAANAADRFTNYAVSYGMNSSDFRESMDAARDAAARLVAAIKADKTSCLATGTPAFADCMKSLVASKGEMIFRRPVTPDEVTEYVAAATMGQAPLGNDDAAGLAFQSMLMSPYFLYRPELGQGTPDASGAVRLTPYELASAISYSLADMPPDDELWKAAAANALSTPEQIRPHVERLLGGLADQDVVLRFFREYLRYDKAMTVAKDPKEFPFHKPELLTDDTEQWLKGLLQSKGRGGLLKELLTSGAGFARAATATNYGIPAPSGTAAQAVTFPAGQRSGILTQPSFLSTYSTANENQPVQRGRFIAERLLCQTIPQIMIPPFKDIGPNATLRDRLKAHSADPGCAACHHLMDPLGLGLEAYDHVGRYRTMFAGKPLDSSGELYGTSNGDGPFKSPVELTQKLAGSPVVWQCFVRHSFRYWMGREEAPTDGCSIIDAHKAFDATGGDYVELVAQLFTSKVFLFRSAK